MNWDIPILVACITYAHCVVFWDKTPPFLGWLYRGLAKLETKHGWLSDPLGTCSYCFSGQLGLWVGVYFYGADLIVLGISAASIAASTLLIRTLAWLD